MADSDPPLIEGSVIEEVNLVLINYLVSTVKNTNSKFEKVYSVTYISMFIYNITVAHFKKSKFFTYRTHLWLQGNEY